MGVLLSILIFLGVMLYIIIFGFNILMVVDIFGYYSSLEEMIVFGIIIFFLVVVVFFVFGLVVFGFIGVFKVKSDGLKVKILGVCFIVLGGL